MTTSFGASTFGFVWRGPALGALRQLQALGLDGFDVVLAPGHCWPAELDTRARTTLAQALEADGIRLESLNFPALDLNLASPVPEVRRYAVDLYGAALELAAELGAPAVVVVPGRVSSLTQPPPEDTERRLVGGLETLLERAAERGVSLFLETHPQTPVPTAAAVGCLVRSIDDPRLRVAYDVANAAHVGDDQVGALRGLAPLLGQVHLSDGSRERWAHDRVGTGTVDFPAVLRALDELGFEGARVLEIVTPEPLEDLRASLETLERLACS